VNALIRRAVRERMRAPEQPEGLPQLDLGRRDPTS
jgi:hypothetical protein